MADPSDDLSRRALAARLAQKLAEPARALLGYQELVVEQAREHRLGEALPDLERVLAAARDLNGLIERLLAGEGASGSDVDDAGAQARLRHDLRTPLNAILGYSEMVAEDFAGHLPETMAADMSEILSEGRALLARIDDIVDFSPNAEAPARDAADLHMAAALARTLSARPAAHAPEAGRILVIDDTASNRDLLARRLTRDGHAVTAAGSAAEALVLLEREAFDLALVDILMPDMNGIELLSRLKADDRWREMAVVMVSGLREDDAVIRCIEAGAEDYLSKPVDPVLLRARIAAALERRLWRERERHYLAQIEFEKERADALLHAVLPGQVIRRLADGEEVIADHFETATILFADIVGFSATAARTPPGDLVQWLGELFGRFDELAERHGMEKIKTIGDAYMAASGLPEPREDHADAAVAFARALQAEMARRAGVGALSALRIGIHSGPVIAGLIGRKRFVYDIWGHTVNVASRLESDGAPGRIRISGSTLAALRARPEVEPEGEIRLRGVGAIASFLLP